jgi:hypothetical protein
MSVVYLARQPALGRLVALKMLSGGAGASPHLLARLRAEARAVARLSHPNIVQIYDVGTRQGFPFLALEHLDGGSLRQRLGGPWPAGPAAALVQVLARAVHYAHERGVVHRDLKPANILFTADGTPKIADFGLAHRLDEPLGQTVTGQLLGTPEYMSPEQAGGDTHAVGPAGDVWALGVILYELLTGRTPFRAADALDTLQLVRSQPPAPPHRLQPSLPRDLETICLKCLRKDPEARYASAQELADDLRRFLGGEPVRARPVGPLRRAWLCCRRPERIRDAGAVMLFLAAVLTATHALVTALRVVGVPGLAGSDPRTALLELLAVLLLYDLPHAGLGWCALRRRAPAVWTGAAHSALGLAWLAAALAGAPWARFALEAEEAAPGPGVGLSLGVPALLLAAVELAIILAALPAAACSSRNRSVAS